MEALRAFGGRSVCVFVLDWLMDDVDDVCYSSTPVLRQTDTGLHLLKNVWCKNRHGNFQEFIV
jgi:hypothetical protein